MVFTSRWTCAITVVSDGNNNNTRKKMTDQQKVQFVQACKHAESIGLTLFKFDGITYKIVK